jgi:hypothetical protein
VRVIVVGAVPKDQEIQAAWNNLVFRMERPAVFFTHQWALAASRAFSVSLSPQILLMYEASQLAGIAAMATTLKIAWHGFLPHRQHRRLLRHRERSRNARYHGESIARADERLGRAGPGSRQRPG